MTAVPSDRRATETYTLVTTDLGICGVAWNAAGLTRVQLPESSVPITEARLQRRPATRVLGARNPWPIIVPCHRVLASGGAMGGFSAYGGTMTKQKLLALEGYGLDALPLFAQ
jgi:hypothetical protein